MQSGGIFIAMATVSCPSGNRYSNLGVGNSGIGYKHSAKSRGRKVAESNIGSQDLRHLSHSPQSREVTMDVAKEILIFQRGA